MSHISDAIGNTAHSQIEDLAARHSSFEAFMQDMERLADKAWHNSRSHADGQQSMGDGEPQKASSGTITNVDDLKPEGEQPVDDEKGPNQAVEPASSQSEAGFPTSNVEIVGGQVEVGESKPL